MNTSVVARIEAARGGAVRVFLGEAAAWGSALSDQWLDLLERVRRAPENAGPPYWAHVCALYFLAQHRERRALDVVLDLFSLPEATLDVLWSDIVVDGLERILASLCHGDTAPLEVLIEREDVYDFARASTLDALQCSFEIGELPRRRLVDYLAELFGGRIRRAPGPLWDAMAGTVLELRVVELREQTALAFREGLINSRFEDPDYLAALAGDWSGLETPSFGPGPRILNAPAEIRRWLPPVRIVPDTVGRDAPCPCGSGGKYAHCCLLRAGRGEGW